MCVYVCVCVCVCVHVVTFLRDPIGPNPITLSPFEVVHVAWLVSMKLLEGDSTIVSLVFLSKKTSGVPPWSPPGMSLRWSNTPNWT